VSRENELSKGAPTDAEWAILLDEDHLAAQRKAAEHKYRDMSGEMVKKLRKRFKTDLMALAGAGLEYELISPTFHGHYTRWLRQMWGERFRMTLFARDHYKSTINTIADSIQMALPNDAEVTEWPYCLGPNIKLLLAHENNESSSRFLYEITRAFRDKPLMLALYPELIPSPRVQRMNKLELELPRDQHHREPTFDAIGVSGAAQSRHYNWLKMDDLVGREARDSMTVMASVRSWFDNTFSLLTRPKLDGWDLIGTRWSTDDVYGHAERMYGVNRVKSILRAYDQRDIEKMSDGQLCIYARGAVEDGLPVFPEEFAIEDLNRLRRNPQIWAAQYANNPREAETYQLQPKWLRFYNVGAGDKLVVFTPDGSRSVRTRDLDRVILIDPSLGESNKSDEAGFVVTGTDEKLNVYVLEAYRKRLKPPDLMDELIRLYVKWNPRLISLEEVAFQAVLKYWFEEKCKGLGIFPSIYGYKPGPNRSKAGRIQKLGNYGAAGQLYCLEGMHQLRDEWEYWHPKAEVDHLLDALAQGPEVWAPGRDQETPDDVERKIRELSEDRDELTGYSSIEYA
jgi:hypothetical protein